MIRSSLNPTILALALAVGPAAASTGSGDLPTAIGALERNSIATVAGTVHRITDEDEFVLADATGRVRIYVGPDVVPVRPGEAVTVTGFVDDGLRLEIYAREIRLADGTVFTFDHRY